MVLMFTDIVGSVDLKMRLGGGVAARLIGRHDVLFREALAGIPDARVLKDMGDGFLARFVTASDAVTAALRFQLALAREPGEPQRLRARVGIHLGEVSELAEASGGDAKVVGLAADITARVMGLALGGQTLLTRAAFDASRQYVRSHPLLAGDQAPLPALRWMAHGRYLLKGLDEPMEVFEVGGEGVAPFQPPPDGDKARRAVGADEEATLGWRPAAGLEIPKRPGWTLDRKLGDGGFGEVWLGRQTRTREPHVFKFCFDTERLRSFKREITLFRLIRDALGDRPDIARLFDVQLEEAPYFIESEFSERGDLAEWATAQGGIERVPWPTRLDLVVRVADAVGAAHSVGVLHKDIKPGNILVRVAEDGSPRPVLADFGIGIVTDSSKLARLDLTDPGLAHTWLGDNTSTRTGTLMYSPPEILTKRPFTVQGDVFALGVLLYQMVIGDFDAPLATGWERQVDDPLLRADIAACVDGDPARRLPSARDLADRLRALDERRAGLRATQVAAQEAARWRRFRRGSAVALGGLAVTLSVVLYALWRERALRDRAEQAERLAQAQKQRIEAFGSFVSHIFLALDPATPEGRDLDPRQLLHEAAERLDRDFPADSLAKAEVQHTLGQAYYALGLYDRAQVQLRPALAVRIREHGADDPRTLATMQVLADAMSYAGERRESLALKERVVERRRAVLGERDPATLDSLASLATSLYYSADRERGRRMRQEVLDLRTAALGPEHRDTLAARHDVVRMLADEAVRDEDEPGLVAALGATEALEADCVRALGAQHPQTLEVQASRGRALLEVGRGEEAVRLLTGTVATQTLLLGPRHLRTLMSRQLLADAQRVAGDAPRAEQEVRDVLARLVEAFGAEHWATLGANAALVEALWAQQKHDTAVALGQELVEARTRASGASHWTTRQAIASLAQRLETLGRREEAAALRQRLAPER
jgi:serine/threonine-protein kinase